MKSFKNIMKKYQFYFFFLFSGCFLLIFYFSTLNYLNNLSQNLNYVDVTPNDQTMRTRNDNPYFHSFLADSYKHYGVYNLQNNNQITFNGNINHLLHYNMDNLALNVWKNETINAQLILIKKNNPNDVVKNLTIEASANNSQITVETKFMNFINARKNRNNSFITPFDQHIADWIKTDTKTDYLWKKEYQVLPVWITIKTDSEINVDTFNIDINVKTNNAGQVHHRIELSVLDHWLPDLKDQNYYNLDLWQNFDRTLSYYQQFEKESIEINSDKYFEILEPYFNHLISMGEQIFNFNIAQFLTIEVTNNILDIKFNSLDIDSYLKKILKYGFTKITLSSYLLNYQDFQKFINQKWNLSEDQIVNGFDKYQNFLLNYFKNSSWYEDKRPNVYLNFDELSPETLQQKMNNLTALQGNSKVFSTSIDINYIFWTSQKTLEILQKVDRLSISYPYLNFLDANSYNKVSQLVNSREKENKFTSIYSCTADYPANYVKSQPGESAFILLYGLKFNIHNFLRWSYNIWPQDWWSDKGIIESDDPNWQLESGDLYSVYPFDENKQVGLSPRISLMTYGQEQAIKIEIIKKTQPEKVNNIINKIETIYWPNNFKPNWNLFVRNQNKNVSVDQQLNLLITEINKL